MKLHKYYSLYEIIDEEQVFDKLDYLASQSKLNYVEENDIIELDDWGLDIQEIKDLIEVFSTNDVLPYLEKEEDDDDIGYIDSDFLNLDDH